MRRTPTTEVDPHFRPVVCRRSGTCGARRDRTVCERCGTDVAAYLRTVATNTLESYADTVVMRSPRLAPPTPAPRRRRRSGAAAWDPFATAVDPAFAAASTPRRDLWRRPPVLVAFALCAPLGAVLGLLADLA